MKSFIGLFGIVGIQLTQVMPMAGIPISEIIRLLIQAAIGVATVWHMFKKPPSPSGGEQTNL